MKYVLNRNELVRVYSKIDQTYWSYQCGGSHSPPDIPDATFRVAASGRRAVVHVPNRKDWVYLSTITPGRWRDLLETSEDILAELRPGLTAIADCPHGCLSRFLPVIEQRPTTWRLRIRRNCDTIMQTEMTLPVYADTSSNLGYWFGAYKPEPRERVVLLSTFFWARNRATGEPEELFCVLECDSRWGCHVQQWRNDMDVIVLLLRLIPKYAPDVYAEMEHDIWFTLPDEVDIGGYYSMTPDAIYRQFAGLRIDRLKLRADLPMQTIRQFFRETASRRMRLSFDDFGDVVYVYGTQGQNTVLKCSIDRNKLASDANNTRIVAEE
ncbi:MAG: hypothetical protein QXZ09_07945 [Candidatus Methanomethylicaceae archaeon]